MMMFKFDEYPELKKKYKEYKSLERKLRSSLHGRSDDKETYWKIREFEVGEFPKMVFDTFNGKVDYVMVGNNKKLWQEVFNKDYENITNSQKRDLVHILDGDYFIRLPREYYDDPYNEYPSCSQELVQ